MRVEKDIVVSAPVERVYQLWTDFENFPRFMAHVEEVRHVEGDTYHWKTHIGPLTQEWDAEVRGLVPNRTVTWRSISGADNAGAITLASKGNITEMHVVIEYAPNLFERLAELVTHELQRSIEQDLERFRELAEGRTVDAGTGGAHGSTGAAAAQAALASSMVGSATGSSDETDVGTDRGGMKIAGASGDLGDDSDLSTDRGGMKIAGASGDTGGPDDDNPVSRVEVGGLGSDTSPGEDVGATSPEEIEAARRALRGDDDAPPRTMDAGSTNMDTQGSGSTTGATSGYANQASGGPISGTAGSVGGTPPNDPTGGTGSVTTGTGPMGPSLMSYESGTNPPADNFSTGPTAGASTALGGTTVSSGSLTDTGRADATGGMTGDPGPTTASSASLAGAGGLGGGPSDMGGQAATLDLGSTPHGGGTGRGTGDAYGSTVVTQGGPQSYAMPMPAEAMDDTAPTAGTGGMTTSGTGDTSIGGGVSTRHGSDLSAAGASWSDSSARPAGGSNDPPAGTVPTARADQGAVPGVDYAGDADRDLEDPVADPTVGGTGANYSGGTGGWGTEDPTSPGVQGWHPPTRTPKALPGRNPLTRNEE